VKTLCV